MSLTKTWLALSYKLPSEPSRKRVYVWRKLKELGAVYLQQGVGILPDTAEFQEILQSLRKEIQEMEGEASVIQLSFLHLEDEVRLLEDFERLRNEEYAEIEEQCEMLISEIEKEEKRGKYTFAEIEENEEELIKIERWFQKVVMRDFFQASGRKRAEEIKETAAKILQEYTQRVYEADKKE